MDFFEIQIFYIEQSHNSCVVETLVQVMCHENKTMRPQILLVSCCSAVPGAKFLKL